MCMCRPCCGPPPCLLAAGRRYYLSGKDAYRLKLLLPKASEMIQKRLQEAADAMAAQAEAAAGGGGGSSDPAAAAAVGDLANEASDELSSAAESMVLLSKSQLLAEQGQAQQGRDMDPRMSISSDDFVIVK